MAAILARSTTASAVVSARRSQAEQPCVRRSVSAAAWQKAITEADLEKADVSNSVGGALFLLSFFRKIKTAVSLFGNRNWENKALGLIDAKDRIECAARRSGPRAKIPTPRSKKLSLSLLAIFLSQPRPATFPSSLHQKKKKKKRSQGQRAVCEVAGDKVLVAKAGGKVFAVSNKCSHLGLSLVGKTALLQGKVGEVGGKQCITCPAHGTAFSLEDGSVQGEWCPKLPNLPLVGKLGPGKAPLKTFASRVEAGTVEVDK